MSLSDVAVVAAGGSTLQGELLELMGRGTAMDAIMQALRSQGSLSETVRRCCVCVANHIAQEIIRLAKAFNGGCVAIAQLLSAHVQLACSHLLAHLSVLRGYALWPVEFGELGLSLTSIDGAISSVQRLFVATAATLDMLGTVRNEIRAFFRWLLWGRVEFRL